MSLIGKICTGIDFDGAKVCAGCGTRVSVEKPQAHGGDCPYREQDGFFSQESR